MTEVKVGKSGVLVSVSEDVVANSMWDVLALYVEAAGYAMMRWKEEKIFNEFKNKAVTVCDNTLGGAYLTKGIGTNGASGYYNGTLAYTDLIDAMGTLIANGYVPTDIIMHPLAWTIFMKDPRLQFQLLGQAPGYKMDLGGASSIPTNLPWNINVAITPFTTYNNTSTNTALPASAISDHTGPTTDIYITDRNNGIVILQSEAMTTDQFDDPKRDITSIKFKEKYGIGLLNAGKSAVALKNIRLDDNEAPLYNTFNLTTLVKS